MLDHIDLQNVLVLDIETVPQFASFAEVPEEVTSLWEQKTQYQRREGETPEGYYPRAGIWAEFGKVACISVGAFYRKNGQLGLKVKSFASENETDVLEDFISMLRKQPSTLTLCAHNGKEFDFPYLCRRLLINCMEIPSQLQLAGKKPWEINHIDTMELWKFGDYKNYTSLNLLASVFNIPTPKDDISGADVHRVYWEEKDLARIKNYCQKDVITTAQLLLKFKCQPLIPERFINFLE